MDILEYNRNAWDNEVARGNRWTQPVDSETIQRARGGDWQIVLTPAIPVPRSWFPPLDGRDVLCLASGGGQQGPILAAAGGRVTVFDNSPAQLAQDRSVGEREGLEIRLVQGDMADLSVFPDQSFDLIFHPCSNCFAKDVLPVWREAFRVMRPGGVLLAGFHNPVVHQFDPDLDAKGVLQVKFKQPYSDLESLNDEERRRYTDKNEPLVFGHSLTDQIGGQLAAGFVITALFEDTYNSAESTLDRYLPSFIATRAVKPVAPVG